MKPTHPLHGLALAFLFSATALFAAEPQSTDVFTSGNDGYLSTIKFARFPIEWISEKP